MPLGPVSADDLERGSRYAIEQPSDLDALILPQRQFWILTPDSDNPESGVYASWGRMELGVPFILLCRQELVPQLEDLRNERLMEWNAQRDMDDSGSWVEFQHCMVISQAWSGITIENKDLCAALQPVIGLNVSVAGGLRVPDLGGWLDAHGPSITIFGFQTQADVCIIRVTDE